MKPGTSHTFVTAHSEIAKSVARCGCPPTAIRGMLVTSTQIGVLAFEELGIRPGDPNGSVDSTMDVYQNPEDG